MVFVIRFPYFLPPLRNKNPSPPNSLKASVAPFSLLLESSVNARTDRSNLIRP